MPKKHALADMPRRAAEEITAIAREQLGIATLETRNSDRLDFHDCSVTAIRDALIDAYQAGAVAALDATRQAVSDAL